MATQVAPPKRTARPFTVVEELTPQRQETLDEKKRKTDRPTSVWYWRPPVTRGSPLTTTGLFQDCFYSKDGWRERMVIHEREKFGLDLSGKEVYHELVLPVEAHGLTVSGTPVVVMRHLGWDDEPLWVVLAALLIRARSVGIAESTDCPKRPTRSHAERIGTLLDVAEQFGHLPALARGACPVVADEPSKERVPPLRYDPVRESVDRR